MTRNSTPVKAVLLAVSLFASSPLLFSQQSNLQTIVLAPAAVRFTSNSVTTTSGIAASITRAEHLPYLAAVAKEPKFASGAFKPTPSDVLIQQAEEKFRQGKELYQDKDFGHAREQFDSAIGTMLEASDNPSDRTLFESRLEDMVDTIHGDDLAGMGAAAAAEEISDFDKAPLDDLADMTFPVDPSIKRKVQNEIQTTSSALPLVVNDTVLSYINYFNGRGRGTIEAGLERQGRYGAMISRILAEEGVPQELIHLAQAESGFLPRAVSRASAEGLWQFVKYRGNEYGLMQSPSSDDRLDPEKATRAAAKHLHDLYNEFGDWYLAMAAYNCGPGAIEKAVERTGYADFWELRARGALPRETQNYVPIILAMTIMTKNASAYGLDQVKPEAAIEYDTIRTTAPTNLALISDITDVPLPQLVQLNPSLLKSLTPLNFEIRVPKGTADQVTAALEKIPAERRGSWRMHVVAPGESLASIARLYSSAPAQIALANELKDEPASGAHLLIPAAYHEAIPARPSRVRSRSRVSSAATRKAPTKAGATATSAARPLHASTGTLAQVKNQSHSLNR